MATAVDKMVPPGPLRDELNAGLQRSALFRLPVDRATLAISDGPYAGVEVTVDRSVDPVVRKLLIGLVSGAATPAEERDLFTLLETRVILGWNVADHKGKHIPATARGFAFCPPALVARIITEFLAMTAGAPVPAPVGPPSGEVPTFGPVPPTP